MQIRKHYRYSDQNGNVWFPVARDSGLAETPWRLHDLYDRIQLFSDDGANETSTLVCEFGPFDTIFLENRALDETEGATVPAGPVVVETRKRIVSGTYRFLQVLKAVQKHHIGVHVHHCEMTAVEIRTLIAQLTEIADALEENGQ